MHNEAANEKIKINNRAGYETKEIQVVCVAENSKIQPKPGMKKD